MAEKEKVEKVEAKKSVAKKPVVKKEIKKEVTPSKPKTTIQLLKEGQARGKGKK